MRILLEALDAHVDPKVIERLGIRYIDRVSGENLVDLPKLVRPEVGGILASSVRDLTLQALSETIFALPEEQGALTARWGLMPARRTVDPSVMEPVEEPTWILDLDASQEFTARPIGLEVEDLLSRTRALSERAYSVFRWAVTDEFLRRHGGEP